MRCLSLLLLFASLVCATPNGIGSVPSRTVSDSSPSISNARDAPCSCVDQLGDEIARSHILWQLEMSISRTSPVGVIRESEAQWLAERIVVEYTPRLSFPITIIAPRPPLTSGITQIYPVHQYKPLNLYRVPRTPPPPLLLAAPPSGIPSPQVLAALCNIETRFNLEGMPTRYCIARPSDYVDWSISPTYETCPRIVVNVVDVIEFQFPECAPNERGILPSSIMFGAAVVVSMVMFGSAVYGSWFAQRKFVSDQSLVRVCLALSVAAVVSALARTWRLAGLFVIDDVVIFVLLCISYVRGLKAELYVLQQREEERELKRQSRNRAAAVIARSFKGFQLRKQFQSLRHAVRFVQERVRHLQRQRSVTAASTLQTAARRWFVRRKVQQEARRTRATVKLQAFTRGVLLRRQMKREVHAATVIQAAFRAHLARRAIHSMSTLAGIKGVSAHIVLSAPSFSEQSPIVEYRKSTAAFSKMLSIRRSSMLAKKKHELAEAIGIVGTARTHGPVWSTSSHHKISRASMQDRRPMPLSILHTKKHTIRG